MTFDDAAQSPAQRIAVSIKIEGVGAYYTGSVYTELGSDGRTRFVSDRPSFVSGLSASAQVAFLDIIWGDGIPRLLEEDNDELGGFSTASAISFGIVDVDNYLTQQCRVEAPGVTRLTADITGTATSFAVESSAGLATGTVIYVGNEAMRLTGIVGPVVTVTRGYMGTDARPQKAGYPVHRYLPYLENREVELSLIPLDAADETEQKSLGQWAIDSVEWDPGLNAWIFEARGRLKYLQRRVPAESDSETLSGWYDDAGQQLLFFRRPIDWQTWIGTEASSTDIFYVRIGTEVMSIRAVTLYGFSIFAGRRGVVDTELVEPAAGDTVHRVFVAESNENCSFRFSPGGSPSTSRSSGTWTKTSHWLDLIMIIAMSSSDSADDTAIANNFNASFGNFASLPPGYGAGLPYDQINWQEYLAVKMRTLDYQFGSFVFGDEVTSFAELIDENFLKPIGAYLSYEGGTVRIVLPRVPSLGRSSVSIGSANILTRRVGPGVHEPRMRVRYAVGKRSEQFHYRVGQRGVALDLNADSPYGLRTYYRSEAKAVSIDVPGVLPHESSFLQGCLQRRAFRLHRPSFETKVDVDLSLHASVPGELVDFTLPEMPDLGSGTRNWVAVLATIINRGIHHDVGTGWYISLLLRGYGPSVKIGKVGPSAAIASVASNTATVVENRYTYADAVDGLPVTDASAFMVDDVCRLINPDGTDAGGGTQIITSISGNDIEFDSDFSSSLAADLIIVHAEYDETIVQQKNKYAFFSDEDRLTPDSSSDGPYLYGEP